jgi:hypothetical protein
MRVKRYYYIVKPHRTEPVRDRIFVYKLTRGKLVLLNQSGEVKSWRDVNQCVCDVIHSYDKSWKPLTVADVPANLNPKEDRPGVIGISSGMSYNAVSWAYSESMAGPKTIEIHDLTPR